RRGARRPRGPRAGRRRAWCRRAPGRLVTGRIDLQGDIGEILLTEEQIASKGAELGARIGADYGDQRLTLVAVLHGSLPFMADLMRAIPSPVRLAPMAVRS